MKNLIENKARISYVENLVIKDRMDSRIIRVENLEESLRDLDVLVVSKKLTDLLENGNILALLKREDLWILDPSRILLKLEEDIANSLRYLTIGKGK
jgi:hypothetical protein